ncbi:MAG: VOC family protein [Bryobacteraceae bacterium]|nr:VOC family protein [Bryobacteraceae bacterium]
MTVRAITALLRSTDVAGAIDFYTKLLGFEVRGMQRREDGTPFWCYLQAPGCDAAIMFAVGEAGTTPSMTGSLYIYSNDIRAAWDHLKDKAKVDYSPVRMFYDMVEFGIHDPHGYLLRFGQDVSEVKNVESIPVFTE